MSGAPPPGPGGAAAVFAVVGPSGAGKDTLIAALIAARPDIAVVRRVITRPEALGGEPFEGVDASEFARRRAAGDFVLDWQAHGLSYGIPAAALAGAAGRAVLFNGSRAMLAEAARRFPHLCVLMVTAPPAVLAERLAGRGRESAAEIARRLERAPAFADRIPSGLDLVEIDNSGPLARAVATARAAIDARLAGAGAPQAAPVRG